MKERKQTHNLKAIILIQDFPRCCAALCLVAQSCSIFSGPRDYSLPNSSVHGNSPGKNTGVGCHALLQRVFSTQGLNPGLPHCRWILYCLSHQGSPSKKWGTNFHVSIIRCVFLIFYLPISASPSFFIMKKHNKVKCRNGLLGYAWEETNYEMQ